MTNQEFKESLTTGLNMFDLLQFFTMDNLWYNGDTYQLRKVISYYLDKVDTNHLVIKIIIKIKDLIDLCLHFCSGFFIKYPQKSSIVQKNQQTTPISPLDEVANAENYDLISHLNPLSPSSSDQVPAQSLSSCMKDNFDQTSVHPDVMSAIEHT